jgi:hypothetical protein
MHPRADHRRPRRCSQKVKNVRPSGTSIKQNLNYQSFLEKAMEEAKTPNSQKKAEVASQKKAEVAAAKEAARAERLARLESERFAQWLPDDKCPNCRLCSKKFGLTSWHHHCRYCGNVICGDCSRHGAASTLVPEIQRYEAFNPDKDKKKTIRMCTKCDAGVSGLIAALRGGCAK